MKIVRTNINISFPKIENYRKKYIDNEDLLSEKFMPATILNLSEPIPDEMPRIIVQSKNGHSVLNLSLNSATFSTNYDNEYQDNWELCEKYIKERVNLVYKMIDKLTDNHNNYVGFVVNLIYDGLKDNGLDIIKKSFLNTKVSENINLYDVNCRLTYRIDNYFLNLQIENIRNIIDKYGNIVNGDLSNSINVVLEINDRAIANESEKYISSKEVLNEILDIAGSLVKNNLDEKVVKPVS